MANRIGLARPAQAAFPYMGGVVGGSDCACNYAKSIFLPFLQTLIHQNIGSEGSFCFFFGEGLKVEDSALRVFCISIGIYAILVYRQ